MTNPIIPDPRDVGEEFYFKQARKVQIEDNYQYSSKNRCCLTSSNRYGLIFVCFSKGVKVFPLKNLLAIDNSVHAQRTNAPLTDVPHQQIVTSNFPLHLALSCDDLTLAVCFTANDGCIWVEFYDIRLLANQSDEPKPFSHKLLSNDPKLQLRDLSWNPSQCEVFATCLSNGAVCIYQVKGTDVQMSASSETAGASAICWSPKGKQLVAGVFNGCLTQFKLNMQIAKTVEASTGFQKPHSVVNICWISSFLFAVVYKDGCDNQTSFVIVGAPKGGAVSYTNYEDILMCSGQSSSPAFHMKHLPEWNMLMVSSNIALETGVFGVANNEKTLWEPWILEDNGRAELPVTKSAESYAAGMSISFSAQDDMNINDQLKLPPMPVLLLLSTSGVLCPFHAINTKPNMPRLTTSLETVPLDGIRRGRESAVTPSIAINLPQMKLNTQSIITSTPKQPSGVAKKDLMTCFNQLGDQSTPPQKPVHPSNTSVRTQPSVVPSVPVLQDVSLKPSPNLQPNESADQEASNAASVTSEEEPSKDESTAMHDIVMAATLQDEITGFHKELFALKERCSTLKIDLGDVKNKTELKESTEKVSKDTTDVQKAIKDFSQDMSDLKNMVLENFCVAEEARSINFRNRDQKFLHLLRSRGLDPIAKKNMSRIGKLYQYVGHQLQEVQKILDCQWSDYLDLKKQQSKKLTVPSTETIYRSLKNISKINRLKKLELVQLSQALKEMHKEIDQSRYNSDYVSGFSSHQTVTDSELSTMADSLLKIQTNEDIVDSPKQQNLSPEKQSQLKDFLSRRKVTPVKCTKPENLSESRFLSLFIQEAEEKKMEEESKLKAAEGNISTTTPQPIYEDITPPETPAMPESEPTSVHQGITPQNLFTGGSTSSAFSAPPKSFEICPTSSFGAASLPKAEKPADSFNQTPASIAQQPTVPAAAGGANLFSSITSGVSTATTTQSAMSVYKVAPHTISPPNLQTSSSSETITKPFFSNSTSGSIATTSMTSAATNFSFTLPSARSENPFGVGLPPKSVETSSVVASPPNLVNSSAIFKATPVSTSEPLNFNIPATTSAPASKPFNFTFTSGNTDFKPFGSASAKDSDAATTKAAAAIPFSFTLPKASDPGSQLKTTSVSSFSFVLTKPLATSASDTVSKQTTVSNTSFGSATVQSSTVSVSCDTKDEVPKLSSSNISAVTISSGTEITEHEVPKNLSADSEVSTTSTNSSNSFVTSSAPVLTFSQELPKTVAVIPANIEQSLPANTTTPASNFTFTLEDNNKDSQKLDEKKTSESSVIEVSALTGKVAPVNASELKHSVASLMNPSETVTMEATPVTTSASSFTFTLGQTVGPAAAIAVTSTSTTSNNVTSPVFGNTPSFGIATKPEITTVPFAFGNMNATGFGTSPSAASGFTSPPTASLFGGTATQGSSQPVFGSLTQGTSVFGNTIPSFGSPGGFGSQTNTSSSGSTFGFGNTATNETGNLFGNKGFFTGLGAKPSAENENRNVFATPSFGASGNNGNASASSIFGKAENTNIDFSSSNDLPGSFSSMTNVGVGQTGFGGFQMGESLPQSQGAFGGTPAFGQTPAFGGSPAFGGTPAFGGSPSKPSGFGSAVFGSKPAFGTSSFGLGSQSQSAFTNNSNSALFGSSQVSNAPSFGSVSEQGGFGSPAAENSTQQSKNPSFFQWRS